MSHLKNCRDKQNLLSMKVDIPLVWTTYEAPERGQADFSESNALEM